MARKIIVEGTHASTDGNLYTVSGEFWFSLADDLGGTRKPKPPSPLYQNRWRGKMQVVQAELDAINAGEVLVVKFSESFAMGTPLADMRTRLQTKWTERRNNLQRAPEPGAFEGYFWDGSAWDATGP